MAIEDWERLPLDMLEDAAAAAAVLARGFPVEKKAFVRKAAILAHQIAPLVALGLLRRAKFVGSEMLAVRVVNDLLMEWDDERESVDDFAGRLNARQISELREVVPTWANLVLAKLIVQHDEAPDIRRNVLVGAVHVVGAQGDPALRDLVERCALLGTSEALDKKRAKGAYGVAARVRTPDGEDIPMFILNASRAGGPDCIAGTIVMLGSAYSILEDKDTRVAVSVPIEAAYASINIAAPVNSKLSDAEAVEIVIDALSIADDGDALDHTVMY